MATRTKRHQAQLEQAPVRIGFTRADPAELARFDPVTKICSMNCGPHRDDPRTPAERKLLCQDCWPNARLSGPQRPAQEVEDGTK